MSNNLILTHLSEMPFGKHQGTPMQDVPASYLHWLYTNDVQGKVLRYIKENLNELKLNFSDGIWER